MASIWARFSSTSYFSTQSPSGGSTGDEEVSVKIFWQTSSISRNGQRNPETSLNLEANRARKMSYSLLLGDGLLPRLVLNRSCGSTTDGTRDSAPRRLS